VSVSLCIVVWSKDIAMTDDQMNISNLGLMPVLKRTRFE
jgi:hypothetical protein